jgi:hypothetical protein
MADQPQPTVGDKAAETLVLGIELVGAEIDNLPSRLITALQSADVQGAIKKALNDFALDKLKATPTTLSAQDGQDLAQAVAKAGGEAIGQNVLDGITNSSHFQALDASLKDLTAALKKTPMGVWVDKNKTYIYIVAAGGVLAGAAAMYVTRSGDDVTKRVMPLIKDLSTSFTPIGQLTLKAGVESVTFVPSKRYVEAKTFVTAEWENIEVKLNLGVTAADRNVTVTAQGQILIPVTSGVKLTTGGSYDSSNQNWSLHIGVNTDLTKGVELGVFAGVGKGGLGAMPDGDAFKAIPAPTTDNNRPAAFVGLGISAKF